MLLIAALVAVAHGCTSFGPILPGVSLFGHSWNTSIRSPFGISGTRGKPHYFQEVVQAYGSFGPVNNTTYLSKYYFDFRSKWLHIVNDTVDASDPADSLSKIWMSYIDPGAKSSGYHEAVANFRCAIQDKLSQSPNSYTVRTCQARTGGRAGHQGRPIHVDGQDDLFR